MSSRSGRRKQENDRRSPALVAVAVLALVVIQYFAAPVTPTLAQSPYSAIERVKQQEARKRALQRQRAVKDKHRGLRQHKKDFRSSGAPRFKPKHERPHRPMKPRPPKRETKPWRPKPPKKPVIERPSRPHPGGASNVSCSGGRVAGRSCVCPSGTTRKSIGHYRFVCIRRPGNEGGSGACHGGKKVGRMCVCPPRHTRISVGHGGYRCTPSSKPPGGDHGGIVCRGGKVSHNTCVCGRGARRITVRRGVYACIDPAPEVICKGGRTAGRACLCPARHIRKVIARNSYVCIPVIAPPGEGGVICKGGRVSQGACYCRRDQDRIVIGRRAYACVDREVTLPPPDNVVCKGGRAYGKACICGRGDRRVVLGRGVFACVDVPTPPPVVVTPPPSVVPPPSPPSPPRVVVAPPPSAGRCIGGFIQRGQCRCLPGRVEIGGVCQLPPGSQPSAQPPTGQAQLDQPQFEPDEVLFAVAASEPEATENAIATQLGITILERQTFTLANVRIVRGRVPDGSTVPAIVAALQADPRVVERQPNFLYRRSQGSAAGGNGLQYALTKVKATAAHRLARGNGVTVAVLDSEIDVRHPDVQGVITETFDATGEKRSQPDPHGTGIAGIIAGRGTVQGIAPDARILAVRAFRPARGGSPTTNTYILMKALDWSVGKGARVLNMSFEGPRDPLFESAVAEAHKRRAILVAAAGNGGEKAAPAYPAAYSQVIAVTATDDRDRLYEKANRGSYITLAAPGVDILVPSVSGSHEMQSGTSFAAAHISGVVALILERDGSMTDAEVRSVLAKTAEDLGAPGPDPLFGAGRVNALTTLEVVIRPANAVGRQQ